MYFNTTMSNSFFIVSITGLILFCIYFSMFLVQKFIDCETETGQISEKECCEGTWRGLTSSVILVLILTGIVTIVSFGIFFFTVRYLYSVPPSTTIQSLSTSIQQAKQNISPPPKLLSDEELKVLQERNIQGNVRRETAISKAAAEAAKALEEQNIQGNIERQTRLGEIEAAAKKEVLYQKAAEANALEYKKGITQKTNTGVVENILKQLKNNNFVDAVTNQNADANAQQQANTQAAANAPK